jgi:hypothetical protein
LQGSQNPIARSLGWHVQIILPVSLEPYGELLVPAQRPAIQYDSARWLRHLNIDSRDIYSTRSSLTVIVRPPIPVSS